jgi:predicted dehydrogenase
MQQKRGNESVGLVNRRSFIQKTASAALITGLWPVPSLKANTIENRKKIRVGIIGCGSVSWKYIPDMQQQDYIEIVSCCDIILSRAQARAKDYNIPKVYTNIEDMLAGVDFDLLVNLTSMPAHYAVNKRGLEAGKHVWSEKPMARLVSEAEELIDLAKKKGVGFWAAPAMVLSPKFRFMAQTLAEKKLGRVCAARAIYGHNGSKWLWAPEFFMEGGGCLYDLGVYNIITLTGLLGPVKRVAGMWNIVNPEVTLKNHEGEQFKMKIETDENAMLMMEHEGGIFSHVQTGFCYFDQEKPHDTIKDDFHSLEIIGDEGHVKLVGYDWGPVAVDLSTKEDPQMQRYCTDAEGFRWQMGASHIAHCLLTGEKPLITAQHALHALEIMNACRESCNTSKYVAIKSRFNWPVIRQ